jgi:hypothetical protein
MSAVLAVPATASAATPGISAGAATQLRALVRARLHRSSPRRGFESRLELTARQGYEISVVGEDDFVVVEVTRPSRGEKGPFEKLFGLDRAATLYAAKGTVTPRRIAASFGSFGQVDVRFRPSGRVVKSRPGRHCRGTDRFSSQLGVFVGKLRFSGEKHYVEVRSHRAKGRIRSPRRLRCASLPPSPRSESRARPVRQQSSFDPGFFTAGSRLGVSATELIVFRGRRTTLFLGFSEESLGSTAKISYGLATTSSGSAFAINDALTHATVAPPAPFHGKGTYRAAPDGTTTWTGSLSLSVPGAPRLPLAGEGFEASFEAGF